MRSRVVLWIYCALLLGFLIAPIVVVMITSLNDSAYMDFPPHTLSLRWYANFFASPQWTDPAWLSLRIALIVSLSATTLGTLAAIGLLRGRPRGGASLELFFISPMIVPVIVMALGLYFLFSALHLLDTPLALCLGHTVISTPLVIVLVRAGLRATDPVLELAARSLGARPWRVLLQITLPAIRDSVAIAAVFAFLVSFDEVVLAIFLGGPAATTLPKRMWETIQFEIDPTLTAISTLLTLAAIAVLAVAGLLRGRALKPRSTGG
jgi:ABC-type spermidine/putrescine transport system permease subunit II